MIGELLIFNKRTHQKDEYLTPPEIIRALGKFELDPCAPIDRPWDMARLHYTRENNGLDRPWFGRVWLNPPYGNETGKWLQRLKEHGNGIALIFARTETKNFHNYIWPHANAILFIRGRVAFYSVEGKKYPNAPSPSCLVAYGRANAEILRKSLLDGFYVDIR